MFVCNFIWLGASATASIFISQFFGANDKEKSIYKGIIYVDAYDMNGTRVTNDSTRLKIPVTKNSPSTEAVESISGLQPNQVYRIVVTTELDRDNNGVADPEKYMKEETANTTISANANVSISYNPQGKLVFKLLDVVNFDGINKIVYSIDSDNGATNYDNGSNSINDWKVDTSYIFTTDFKPGSGSYHYSIQYYQDNNLKGSSKGYFTK